MRKDITPSQFTVNGIADISGFGGDVDTVFLGRLSTLGAPVTNIIISPTTGNINGHATNNIDFKADSNLSLKTDNNLYLESSQDLFTTAKNSWIGGVSDGTITAGQYRADFAMNPFAADPVTIFELKKNQNYAMGFAALDTPGHQFSNIYYGVLDATNTITDITRLEANQDEAHMFARNIPGTLNSKLAIFPDMLEASKDFSNR
jgi:hypothetical protein